MYIEVRINCEVIWKKFDEMHDNMNIINRFLKELFIFMNRIKRVRISNFGT
jgi:hypothetical protein